MQITAKIIESLPMVKGVRKSDGAPWAKKTIIVETFEQYPKKLALSNVKRPDEFNALSIGGIYCFDFNVESRQYEGRWFTEATCWNWSNV